MGSGVSRASLSLQTKELFHQKHDFLRCTPVQFGRAHAEIGNVGYHIEKNAIEVMQCSAQQANTWPNSNTPTPL